MSTRQGAMAISLKITKVKIIREAMNESKVSREKVEEYSFTQYTPTAQRRSFQARLPYPPDLQFQSHLTVHHRSHPGPTYSFRQSNSLITN
jgi:hypothetical protein